jgi:hypothetical protein
MAKGFTNGPGEREVLALEKKKYHLPHPVLPQSHTLKYDIVDIS